jgi:hypothetical protein
MASTRRGQAINFSRKPVPVFIVGVLLIADTA